MTSTCATPVSLGTFTPPLVAEWRWSGSLWEGLTRAYPSSPPPVPICCRLWWMLLSGGCWAWSSGPSAPTGPVTTLISTVIEGNWMESAPLGQPGLRRCWWYLRFHCGGVHRWWNTLVSTWVIVGGLTGRQIIWKYLVGLKRLLLYFCVLSSKTSSRIMGIDYIY